MTQKKIPFSNETIKRLVEKYPTPFHIYDKFGIVENAKKINEAFSWNKGFREYFAVKATPNPRLMELLRDQGLGMDCSSLAELVLCERVGIAGEAIMFTSNETPAKEYAKAKELGAIINLDDISHIEYLNQECGLPELISFRYNPGPLRAGNVIIGKPEDAKFGFTRDQLFAGYKQAKELGVKRFGLHTMVASNELNPQYFVETVQMLLDLVVEISKEVGITFEFINMGGGIGIPYRPEQQAVDYQVVSRGVKEVFEKTLAGTDLPIPRLLMECGRVITGPYGFLITRALHKKDIYKKYVGVDACMANLMRPGMYGSYHHITVLGKEGAPANQVYDVVGSLCENNDKLAVDRELPNIDRGDILVIHDTGAHGHSMGFNYNGKLRSAEILVDKDGSDQLIRRAETLDDLFATLV